MSIGPFDVEDAVARAVRRSAPVLRDKPLGLAYDSRMAPIDGIGDAAALQDGIHRLVGAAIEVLDDGFMMVALSGSCIHQRLRCSVTLAATARSIGSGQLEALVDRLGLHDEASGADGRLRRALGRCPHVGATIRFAGVPGHGMLLEYQHRLPAAPAASVRSDPDARQARAWVIDEDESAGQVLVRRLQRLGWATWQFRSMAQAMRRARTMQPAQARPALVVSTDSHESPRGAFDQLARRLPRRTRCVVAAPLGSAILSSDGELGSFEVRAWPLSHTDLVELTLDAAGDADAGSGETRPAPLLFSHRRTVLIVDDDEVNAVLLANLAASLGLEATWVDDGVHATQACMRHPPDLVLMDLSMPGLDGIETTRRLRALQRQGTLPAFPIIGASSDAHADDKAAWHAAGVDTVLSKPTTRELLRSAMQRLCGWRTDSLDE